MIKYVMYKASAESKNFKKYYPLCTTEVDTPNFTLYEIYNNLEEALSDLQQPGMYFPELDRYGCYVEYFIQVEEWDDDDEFIQATELYDWNYDGKYVWRENNRSIEVFELEVVRNYMDSDICEEINKEFLFNSEQEFFVKYLEMHEDKYEKEFDI